MKGVYRTCSDAKGSLTYPSFLAKRVISRAVVTSAERKPHVMYDKSGEGFRALDLPYGGYRTRTEFRRDEDAWNVCFDLLPTADLHAAAGYDDATYFEIQRDLGIVQYFAVACALSDLTERLPYSFIDMARLGRRRAEHLANGYTFAPRRAEYDLDVRVRWTLPRASLRDESFVENLAALVLNAERAFPPPVDLRLDYLTSRAK